MPVTITRNVPDYFTAGETVRFAVEYSEYPTTAWAMQFVLRGSVNLTKSGVVNGTAFEFVLTAAETATFHSATASPGVTAWSLIATEIDSDPSEKVRVDTGTLRIYPDLTNVTKGPRRTAYEAALAAWESLASKKNSSVSFNGQSYTLRDSSGLKQQIDRLHMEALAEDKARGISGTGGGLVRIRTRM